MGQITNEFLVNVAEVLQNAKHQVKTAVNLAMVYAYYEIGRMIVEEEQKGNNRAKYGEHVLEELAEYLTAKFGKGYSRDNLGLMRKFYLIYSKETISETVFPKLGEGKDLIGQTPSDQFVNIPQKPSVRRFFLSWSHYLKLMRITNADERRFYEIESIKNDWSLRELKRQYDSSLYERLLLSSDIDKVKQLSTVGQVIERPEDNKQIFASKYETVLPSKEELRQLLCEE